MIHVYARQMAEKTLSIRAVQISTKKPFLWASGYWMPIYNDNRLLLNDPAHRRLVAEGFKAIIEHYGIEFDVIAGTSTSGIPHATTLADMLKLPLTYVRDKPKDHGMRNRIEGIPADQGFNEKQVLLIEDLISTGGSSISAVEGIREAGGVIDSCLAIFSYGMQKADEKFAEMNPPCTCKSILTYDILLETALDIGYIKEIQYKSLLDWKEDPFGWGEKHGFSKKEK